MIGRVSSCAAVIAPWLAADAIPTRFSAGFSTSAMLRNVDVPVTMTSAFRASVNSAFTSAVSPGVMLTVRRSTVKLINRNVSSAVPAVSPSKRYRPAASLTVVTDAPLTVSSIVTPGSNAARLIDDTAGDGAGLLRGRRRHRPDQEHDKGAQNVRERPACEDE